MTLFNSISDSIDANYQSKYSVVIVYLTYPPSFSLVTRASTSGTNDPA